MSDFFSSLNDAHAAELHAAPIFFVATAPRAGRINLSPKGGDSLRVLSPVTVAWLDMTGSGNETAAHLLDDGRITLMVCSFTRTANILRLYGHARSVQPADAEWGGLIGHFPETPGTRQIFVMAIESVQTSCGYAVPLMELVTPRETLRKFALNRGEAGLARYRACNLTSIDGLPTGLTNYEE